MFSSFDSNVQKISQFKKPLTKFSKSSEKSYLNKLKKVKYLYKPNQVRFLNNYFSVSDFFPKKKAFSQFWLFPLFGACFYTLLNGKDTSFQFPNFLLSQDSKTSKFIKKKSEFSFFENKTDYSKNGFFTNNEVTGLSDSSRFLANYLKNQTNIHLNNFTNHPVNSFDFENLCLFYLKLTNNNLKNSFSPISKKAFEKSLSFEELFTLRYLQNQSTQFNFLWHSLNQSQVSLSNSQNPVKTQILNSESFFNNPQSLNFPQKLNHHLFALKANDSGIEKNIFNPTLQNSWSQPNISYLKTSLLLDHWIQHFYSQIKNKEQGNFSSQFNNNFLSELYSLEKNFIKNNSKDSLIFYFYNLLNNLTRNQLDFEQFYSDFNFENSGFSKNINQYEKKINPNDFVKKTKKLIQLNLTQIFLQNHLQNVLMSKNHLKSSNQTIFLKNFVPNQLLDLNREKPISSLRDIDENVSNLMEKKFKKLFKYKLLATISNYPANIKSKISLLNRLTSVQKLEFIDKNSNKLELNSTQNLRKNLNAFQTRLNQLIYELIIFQYWKDYFPELVHLATPSLKTYEQNLLKPNQKLEISHFQTERLDENFVSSTFKLTKQLNLYSQLENLLNKVDSHSHKLAQTSNILNSEASSNIWVYQTPILFSKSFHEKKENLNNHSGKADFKTIYDFTKFSKSFSFSEEITSKQTNLKSSSFIYEKELSQKVENRTLFLKSSRSDETKFLKNWVQQIFPTNFSIPIILQMKKSNLDLTNSSFTNLKTKQFQIMHRLKMNENQTFVLGIFSKNSIKSIKNEKPIKYLKYKNELKEPRFDLILQKRQHEKIFRTYLSVKSSESKNLKNVGHTDTLTKNLSPNHASSYEFMSPIFKNIKNRISQKKLKISKKSKLILLKPTEFSNKIFNSTFNRAIYPKTWTSSSKSVTNLKFLTNKSKSKRIMNSMNQNSKVILKKLAFVFLQKSDSFVSSPEIKRLEKKKLSQKKRRLKKLKLENRRRKKRKRFYPRPTYLRFALYSNFLKKRHDSFYDKEKSNYEIKMDDFEKTQVSNIYSKTLINKSSKKMKISTNCKEKIYRKNNQKWGNYLANNLKDDKKSFRDLNFFWSTSPFHEQEFYKISNQTLTEFERLCWKSYWLRSNLNPYIKRIQKNMKKMQKVEKFKNSPKMITNIVKNFFDDSTTLIQTNSKKLKPIAPAYVNIRQNLDTLVFENSYSSIFKQIENKAEYNRLIYERLTDEIKNVKSQLNVDGQSHSRSYKIGRQKIEKTSVKNIWNSINSLNQVISEPQVQPFVLGSAVYDKSLKPFGDLLTLRLLWACNKTHLFTSNQNNFSKNLWANYKKREQTKNNKTKKFISKIFKLSPFHSKNKETISYSKTIHTYEKIQSFGGFTYGKNVKFYLKNLKSELRKKSIFKTNFFKTENLQDLQFQNLMKFDQKSSNLDKNAFNSPVLIQKSQKPMVNFWWSTKQLNPLEEVSTFWFFSPLKYPETDVQTSFLISVVWISCSLFHIALLFTLFRIPEIRGLAKFQFLLLSKLSNIYITSLYSIYDLITDYTKKTKTLVKKMSLISFLNFEEESFLLNQKHQLTKVQTGTKSFKAVNVEKTFFNMSNIRQSGNLFNYANRSNSRFVFKSKDINSQEYQNFLISYSIDPFVKNTQTDDKKSLATVKNNWLYSSATQFLWYNFQNNLNYSKILKTKESYLKDSEKLGSSKTEKSTKLGFNPQKKNGKTEFSIIMHTNIQFQSLLSLFILMIAKSFVQSFYLCFNLFYQILFSLIDTMESLLLILYKFFEKPAELMVDWIAEIFLIEWSSDITAYVPEAFDVAVWDSLRKFSRITRPLGGLGLSFLYQNRFFNFAEIFYNWLLKPDTDLIVRQKKGIIFWDIWAEILIQAAEKYQMNLSTLSTIKAEQELLIENLLEEKSTDISFYSKITASKTGVKTEPAFLNSELFYASLNQMKPLTNFLEIYPSNITRYSTNSIFFKTGKPQNNLGSFSHISPDLFLFNKIKPQSNNSLELWTKNISMGASERWAVNQSLTTQGRDTDLFMDIHPAKSFSHITFLKTYLPAQEILGSLVCEIYSGLFQKKVSKNILLVGSPGTAKSFFIQALAGETELKIVTDNANRYALVQGGVAIGMKLLREVFDSIALHTPCLFLLEDIHIIGERRPMLISDDENSKTSDSVFGAEQEEVHEKNKLIYQLSRHAISHYKRPYKGDFSLSIPTNHFCYDFFLGVSPPRKRNSGLTVKSPLPLAQLENSLEGTSNSHRFEEKSSSDQALLSSLQISTEQIFAPPATSPFNILLMKEQKKLKPKKFVKEMPWSGFSYDQLMLISKTSYSVRAKVAVLAEMAMTTLSVKLDMITDLLVIIDSVRSNRGFVVFATTHMPSLLDPALRRPGRLDETISLPLLPNLMNRFEIFKTHLNYYEKTMDLLDFSLFTNSIYENESEIYKSISKNLLLLLNTKSSSSNVMKASSQVKSSFSSKSELFYDYPIYSLSQAFQTSLSLNSSLFNPFQLKKYVSEFQKNMNSNSLEPKTTLKLSNTSFSELLMKNCLPLNFAGIDKLNYTSLTYAQAGQFLMESLLLRDQTTYSSKFLNLLSPTMKRFKDEQTFFQGVYGSNQEVNFHLIKLLSGKITEFFVLNNSPIFLKSSPLKISSLGSERNLANSAQKNSVWFAEDALLQTNPSQSILFENIQNFQVYWQSVTSFLEIFFQKRYLYNKNSIVSKLLFLQDNSTLREAPSPPGSSILMPAKKFENYKRSLKDFIQKPMLTINEKIQIHQKQRFLKLLYNIPVQKSFRTISNSPDLLSKDNSYTNFYSAFKELSYLDLMTLKPSSTYSFYKNRFLTRHRFSFLNQWWNGQLAEHNVETTYLSHVDWRSMFLKSFGDIVIDFPDAEQFYNPRLRRWFLHSTSWNYWSEFHETQKQEIFEHYIQESFTKTIRILNSNRELLDYLAFRFLRDHQLKEIDLLTILVRFYKDGLE